MGIPFKKFEQWAIDRFGAENVVVRPPEIRINSIFETDDDDFHLWCNPSGGKKKRKHGSFHCFKTEKVGSLVKLVMIVDSCDRDTAIARLNGVTSIRELEKQLEAMFAAEDGLVVEEVPQKKEGLCLHRLQFLLVYRLLYPR